MTYVRDNHMRRGLYADAELKTASAMTMPREFTDAGIWRPEILCDKCTVRADAELKIGGKK